jgi:hypothetical protein
VAWRVPDRCSCIERAALPDCHDPHKRAVATVAILIAISSNNILKAGYSVAFAGARASLVPAGALVALAIAGAAAAAWLAGVAP